MEQKRMLTTPVSQEFYSAIRVIAASKGVSMAGLVRCALDQYLKRVKTDSKPSQEARHERQ